MVVSLGGQPVAEHRRRQAGHRVAEAFTAPAATHRLPSGAAGVGEVEVLDGDRGDAMPAGVVDEAGDRVPHLGIPPRRGAGEQGYHQLWSESVRDLDWFWDAVWHFFDVQAATPPDAVLGSRDMPGAQWFPGATLNYVTEVFRHASDERMALVVAGEDGACDWSWARLQRETAAFAAYLRGLGVRPGDRVVGYLPNIGEAVVAFLGAASVGATWAVCNQDLAVSGVVARLGQLKPTVLVAATDHCTAESAATGVRNSPRSAVSCRRCGPRCWCRGWVAPSIPMATAR